MDVAKRLEEILEGRGWSHARLARVLGEKDRHWVTDRVNRRIAIKADELPRLSRALGVPCADFFAGSDCLEYQQRPALRRVGEGRPDVSASQPEDIDRSIGLSTSAELLAEWSSDLRALPEAQRDGLRLAVQLLSAALKVTGEEGDELAG